MNQRDLLVAKRWTQIADVYQVFWKHPCIWRRYHKWNEWRENETREHKKWIEVYGLGKPMKIYIFAFLGNIHMSGEALQNLQSIGWGRMCWTFFIILGGHFSYLVVSSLDQVCTVWCNTFCSFFEEFQNSSSGELIRTGGNLDQPIFTRLSWHQFCNIIKTISKILERVKTALLGIWDTHRAR